MTLKLFKQRILFLPLFLQRRKWPWLAEKLCYFFLRLQPNHPELLHQLVRILAVRGQTGKVIRFLRSSLQHSPDNPYLHSSLGSALLSCQRFEDGVTHLRKALELKPKMIGPLLDLGNGLNQLGRKESAMDCLRQVITLEPTFANGYYNMGTVLMADNQPSAAITYFEKANRLNPNLANVHIGMGNAFTQLGRFKEAEESMLRGLALEPRHASAICGLSQLKSRGQSSLHLENLEKLLEEGHFSIFDQTIMHFSLAKAYMDMGKGELGFNFLTRGNQLRRAIFHYESNNDSAFFNRIIQSFDSHLFEQRKGCGSPSRVPIFIVGMPRSGTTLVEQIIASHSQVFGAGEGEGLWHLTNEMALLTKSKKGFPEGVGEISQKQWHDLALAYEGGLRVEAMDAEHVTDKMPHNFMNIGLIHLMFPNAVIIHCRREPVDTCLSIYMQIFSGHHPYAYDLAELGAHYRLYDGVMRHWRQVLPNRLLEVQYEQMVAEPEAMARKIISGCGLSWEDACLDFHKSKRPVNTASLIQVRQPIYNSSVGRWKKYQQQLKPLLDALGPLAPELANRDESQSTHG
ncbi:MAG: sulfotransferase [Magnetococcales bacterium]|nr:sulfotransferase [Magnetococcales bacterium]